MKQKRPKSKPPDPIWDLIGEFQIEQIIPLLWKKALATHKRLPLGHHIWIEPEDLFQEAYAEAIRCFRLWDSKRDIKFITFVYRTIDNKMNSLLTYWGAKKRSSGISIDIDHLDFELEKSKLNISPSGIPIDAVLKLLFDGK